jgi:hypothetical protein
MSSRAWNGYLAAAVVVVAGYFLTPSDSWTQTVYAELVGLAATGAIVVGVVKHRPAAKAAWLWFAAGQLLNVAPLEPSHWCRRPTPSMGSRPVPVRRRPRLRTGSPVQHRQGGRTWR